MQWIIALHIISFVSWFAGLFYLPRLFVYHSEAKDEISIHRFKIMERRLYYGITTPAGILTIIFGVWLWSYSFQNYLAQGWFHAKLSCVLLLVIFHIFCGIYLQKFKNDNNKHSSRFYRFFNEIPTILLVAIVILVVVKPF